MLLQGPGSQYRSMVDQLKGVPSSKVGGAETSSSNHDSSQTSGRLAPQDTVSKQYSSDGDSFQLSDTSRYRGSTSKAAESSPTESSPTESNPTESNLSESNLSESEQNEVDQLKERDQEVKRHEQAHASAAGAHSRGISYDYTTGPDQAQYATSGHVDIDMSPVSGDPQATIDKMQTIQRAALAPEEPSSQDRQVQSDALKMETEAKKDLQEDNLEDIQGDNQDGQLVESDHHAGDRVSSDSIQQETEPYQQARRSYNLFESQLNSKINLVA